MGEVVVEREIRCSSDAKALWPIVTDTERLNRAVGLGRLEVTENDGEHAARYVVNTVSGGFPLEYEEQPYEWVENRRFSVTRLVRKGLAKKLENGFRLRQEPDGGCVFGVRIAVEPKFGAIAPVIRLQVSRFVDKILAEMQSIDRELAAGKVADFSARKARLDWVALERAASAFLEHVGAASKEGATQLIDFVSEAPDAEVDRIRPFELADRWGVPRRDMLALCLHAVVAGLLELHWDIVCPSCRTASARLESLEEIEDHGGCHLCDITYDLELDQAVEATFRPAKALREIDAGPYCIGGPARTPHVYAQIILPPTAEVEMPAPDRAGRYRLFVRGGTKASVDVAADGGREQRAVVCDDSIDPAALKIAPGGVIRLAHESERECHVKLERVEWGGQAATAHVVSTLPEFRRLFAREVLRPGLTLRIARVALLFTDLTDSTKMYSVLGDARAFKVVQDHFAVLEQTIDDEEGVIVKTIGDAVMAAFTEESRAVTAAVAMHERMRQWRSEQEDARTVRLKIGLYAGPCYVVTANGILDYFGQTVNVAARLQGKSDAGEIVMTEHLADEALARGWLGAAAVTERFAATLKGVDERVRAARVLVDAGEGCRSLDDVAEQEAV